MENKRFHDLRHTYAVASLESGDDIKTLQDNLGHATVSFTLDKYGHVSKAMKQKSAMNIERFINKSLLETTRNLRNCGQIVGQMIISGKLKPLKSNDLKDFKKSDLAEKEGFELTSDPDIPPNTSKIATFSI